MDPLRIKARSVRTEREWELVALDGRRRVGRLALRAEPMATSVPELEYHIDSLEPPWDEAWEQVGTALLTAAQQIVPPGHVLDVRLNAEQHDRLHGRHALAKHAGFELFQEKEGFWWTADRARPSGPGDCDFRSLKAVGREAFATVLARGGEDTLDRNDRYYWSRTGPEGWAAEMLGFLEPEDEDSALIGFREGQPIGYVMVSEFGPGEGTIAHVGVLPEHRGQGYVHELLAEAARAARIRRFDTMVNEVDVENGPMLAAMERAGHSASERPRHIWHYRWRRA